MSRRPSTIRLGFNARLLQFPDTRGWNRYAVELLVELAELGIEPILYSDRPIHPIHRARLGSAGKEVRISPRLPYVFWEQAWLPRACRLDRVDLLHSPYHFGLPWTRWCPQVLTLHDAIDRALGAGQGGDYRSRFHHWVARTRAHQIITISEHSRNDLARYFGIADSRMTVVPLAADPRFFLPPSDQDRTRARALIQSSGPYLFYVGGWEGRKNLPFLLRAFAQARVTGMKLVLAGGKDDQRAELIELARSLAVEDDVRLLGFVDDADLPALYSEASAFIYPSLYEGFGLQLCEAMASGCPTLAANATSLPEVLGAGGESFPLGSPDVLGRLIARIAGEPHYRQELAKKARARASTFSWRKTAEGTAEVYRSVLAHARTARNGS